MPLPAIPNDILIQNFAGSLINNQIVQIFNVVGWIKSTYKSIFQNGSMLPQQIITEMGTQAENYLITYNTIITTLNNIDSSLLSSPINSPIAYTINTDGSITLN